MTVLSLLQVLAQSTVEDDATTDVPWLTVILVMAVAFGVAAVVIGRLRKKAAEIE